MTPEQATALVIALGVAIPGVLVSVAQLVVALRTKSTVSEVKQLVNGHTQQLQELSANAFERGQASGPTAPQPPKRWAP